MSFWDDKLAPYWDEDDYDAYSLDSPKHPSFHDRYADWADLRRKQEKERELVVDDEDEQC